MKIGDKCHCNYHPPKTYSEITDLIKDMHGNITWVTVIFGKTNAVVSMPHSSFIRDFELITLKEFLTRLSK